eukprot:gene4314-14427_t
MGCIREGAITQEDIECFKRDFQRPGAVTAALNYYRALLRHYTFAPIPKVWDAMRSTLPMPTLVLWAGKDGALETSLNNGIEQVVPQVELHVLEDSSHWVQQEDPVAVNRLMRSFLGNDLVTP